MMVLKHHTAWISFVPRKSPTHCDDGPLGLDILRNDDGYETPYREVRSINLACPVGKDNDVQSKC